VDLGIAGRVALIAGGSGDIGCASAKTNWRRDP